MRNAIASRLEDLHASVVALEAHRQDDWLMRELDRLAELEGVVPGMGILDLIYPPANPESI